MYQVYILFSKIKRTTQCYNLHIDIKTHQPIEGQPAELLIVNRDMYRAT